MRNKSEGSPASTSTHSKSELQPLLDYAVDELHRNAALHATPCKVCAADAFLLGALDFQKSCNSEPSSSGPVSVPVYYWRCRCCDFVFTKFFDRFLPEQWSNFVYNDDYYAAVDVDYNDLRPSVNARYVDSLLGGRKQTVLGLDYGGGNGRTADILQRQGYTYDTYDLYGTTCTAPERVGRYNFCSSFEVAEHTPDPQGFLRDIVSLASPDRLVILVTTLVHDGHIDNSGGIGWWYAAPRNGHISLHSRKSLQLLSRAFQLDCWSESAGMHLFSRGYTRGELWRFVTRAKVAQRVKTALGR